MSSRRPLERIDVLGVSVHGFDDYPDPSDMRVR
jgi:hypothetical protein